MNYSYGSNPGFLSGGVVIATNPCNVIKDSRTSDPVRLEALLSLKELSDLDSDGCPNFFEQEERVREVNRRLILKKGGLHAA